MTPSGISYRSAWRVTAISNVGRSHPRAVNCDIRRDCCFSHTCELCAA
jgi:hypothetical protein